MNKLELETLVEQEHPHINPLFKELAEGLVSTAYPSGYFRSFLRRQISSTHSQGFSGVLTKTFLRGYIEGWALFENAKILLHLYSHEQDRNAFFGCVSSQDQYLLTHKKNISHEEKRPPHSD